MAARRPGSWVVVLAVLILSLALPALAADPPKDVKKHTALGKYVNSIEAYAMWWANQDKVKILDCRTWQEYAFVGHPTMAYNVPSKHFTGKWDPATKSYSLANNTEFEAAVKKMFKADDAILVMCRSGHRSADSVNRLAKAGFTNVYNIVDGFEGDTVSDPDSYFKGQRMVNGWKNSGSPWTYSLNPKLVFVPAN